MASIQGLENAWYHWLHCYRQYCFKTTASMFIITLPPHSVVLPPDFDWDGLAEADHLHRELPPNHD